ncbi:unnamed protein product [Rotaria socialis]
MKIFPSVLLLIFSTLYEAVDGSHFRGGIISWRPLNNTPSGSYASILIHQRYFWYRIWAGFSPPYCNEATVAAQTLIPVASTMTCLRNCSSSTYTPLSTRMTSTDCDSNALIQSWAGERYDTLSLPLTTSITIGFPSNAWLSALYIGGDGPWSIVNRLNLAPRPDGFINTSPVTNTLPVVFVPVNTLTVHVVQMADNDATDILNCRWSNSASTTNYNREDECGSLTTTGIIATTTNMSGSTTTSATTTTTTTTSTATVTTATTTQYVTEMTIITPQDFEAACQQPVAIVTTLGFVAMVPVHIVGLFTLLTKTNKMFNPDFMRAQLRHDRRMWRAGRG